MVGAKAWVGGDYLMGAEFQSCEMKRVLEIGFTTMRMHLTLLNPTLKRQLSVEDGQFYVLCISPQVKIKLKMKRIFPPYAIFPWLAAQNHTVLAAL